MRAMVFPLPSGDAGVQVTVSTMRSLARRASVDPLVRRTAVDLVLSEPLSTHPVVIRDYLNDHTTFIPDPRHDEALHDPVYLLAQILTRGLVGIDCDDVAMLAASLGLSIGLRARYVVLAFGSAPTAPYQHVLTGLQSARGGPWVVVDPTRPAQDFYPQVARSMMIEV